MLQLNVAVANKTAPYTVALSHGLTAVKAIRKRGRQKEGRREEKSRRVVRGGVSGSRGVGGWLLRAPVGLREGSENSLLAPSGDFEIGEPRLGKSLAGLDAFQHPG